MVYLKNLTLHSFPIIKFQPLNLVKISFLDKNSSKTEFITYINIFLFSKSTASQSVATNNLYLHECLMHSIPHSF